MLRGSWVPACLILGTAALLGHDVVQPPPALSASVSIAPDTDGDGLVDLVERQLGTRFDVADTDGDGVSDGEEIARGSSPRLAYSHPRQRPVDVGIVAHSYQRMVHVQLFVYSADGELRGKNLVVNALAGDEGRVIQVPTSVLVRLGGLTSFPSGDEGGRVYVLDLPIRPRTIYTANTLTVSASVAAPSTRQPGTSDVLDLVNIDGTICQRVDSDRVLSSSSLPDPDGDSGGGVSGTFDGSGGSRNMGSVFLPIFSPGGGQAGGPSTPSTSTPGQICVQQTAQVGISGGAVVQEVVGAECVDGWDGFCSPSCMSSVGTRIRSIDPVTYSGG
jgi:hypothetical protein